MRFNERELKVLARSPAADKEGKLLYRKNFSSKGNQHGYKQRWFRLKGNLLFYFKMNETGLAPELEPKGVFVLERCKIQHEPFSDRNNVFTLAFQDDGVDKKHYFSGTSQAQSEEWVRFLRQASYEQLRATLTILQAQILKHTGKDPMEAFRHNIMSVMRQTGEGAEFEPTLRTKADGQTRDNRRDSRRKGVSAREAEECMVVESPDMDVGTLPFLDMPITPRRKKTYDWDT